MEEVWEAGRARILIKIGKKVLSVAQASFTYYSIKRFKNGTIDNYHFICIYVAFH